MKLIKDVTGLYQYITEDRKFRVHQGYPALNAFKCWIVNITDEKTKYFRTLKEVKEYVANRYEENKEV